MTSPAMEDVRFPLYCPLSLLWGYRSVRCRPLLCQLTASGFTDIAMEDLTDHISACYNHYEKLHLKFDAIYSGFLSSRNRWIAALNSFTETPTHLK